MKTYGLRDIIGPIMVGPSSSHTAGALALASMARKLFGEQPERAVFTLYGSFAATGSGHGTDKARVAGILGLRTDDPRVADAFALAKAAGVQVEIVWTRPPTWPTPTPWTSAARAARGAPWKLSLIHI